MTDFVFPEDNGTGASNGDYSDAANFATLASQSNATDYVDRGCSITADFSANAIDVSKGKAFVSDDAATATQTNESRDEGVGYVALVDARSGIALDSGVNHVYIDVDLSTDDSITIETNTSGTPPSSPSLKIAEVDTSSETVTELNRAPDGTFDSLDVIDGDAAISGNVTASNDYVEVAGNTVSFGGSTSINHSDLSNVGSDDHHSQVHDNTDHSTNYLPESDYTPEADTHDKYTDSEAVSAINSDSDHGSTANHDYFSGSHDDLSNIGSSDHHSRYSDSEATSAVGGSTPWANSDLSNSSVTIAGNVVSLGGSTAISHGDLSDAPSDAHHSQNHDNSDHTTNYLAESDYTPESDVHSRYSDSEAVSAVNAQSSLSVDISGDADTLDGNHASAFASSGHNHDSDYVNVGGDTLSGSLIYDSGNSEIDLWEIDGDGNGDYGFYKKYRGDLSGNDNRLELWSHNTTNSDIQIYDVTQDGNIDFKQQLSESGNRVATRTWANSNFNNYSFSGSYTDLSNRSHGNEDHSTSYLPQSDYNPEADTHDKYTDGEARTAVEGSSLNGLHINTGGGSTPFSVGRNSSGSQYLRMEVDDTNADWIYENDESSTTLNWTVNSNDTESSDGSLANSTTLSLDTDENGSSFSLDGDEIATQPWANSNFNNYSFSESHNDLSNVGSSDHHVKTQPSDINSSNWDDYEIQKNGSDGSGVINFKV